MRIRQKKNADLGDFMIKEFNKLPDKKIEPEWYSEFKRNKNGSIQRASTTNAELVLEHDPKFNEAFKYNDFTQEPEVSKTISIDGAVIKKGFMDDMGILFIKSYIERHYDIAIKSTNADEVVTTVSGREVNRYNPQKDYFERVEKAWDGVERAGTLLPDFLGAPRTDLTTLITNIFFTGAVAKVYDPLVKFDFCLDIVGDQGTGKTTLLKKLGREFYVDTIQDFKNKDEYIKMQRGLIVNDDEMQATNSSGFDVIKKFLSTEMLEYRAPYGQKSVRHVKHFVVARTSNQVDYLKDKTGNRRFLPILSRRELQRLHPYEKLDERLVDQFWGEMVHKYKTNGVPYPTVEQNEALEKYREDFVYVDEIENQINRYVDNNDLAWVTSSDIAHELDNIDLVKNRSVANKIKTVMDNKKGWQFYRKSSGRGWKKV